MPKVSVIVAVYNVEKYIERCVRSLFEQTLDDIEYLFVDDCTPDDSIDVLHRVLEYYPMRKSQVVIHRMEKNSGQALVRKWAMLNASGDYVIHCDSDDWVERTMYEDMYNKAKKDDADIVLCRYARTNGILQSDEFVYFNEKTLLSDMLLERTNWNLVTRLIRRELVKKIHYPQANMGEDFSIACQLTLLANKISYIPRAYYYYYYNPDSKCNVRNPELNIKRSIEVKENADYVIKLLIDKKIFSSSSPEILNIKNHTRLHLTPFLSQWRFYKLWITRYPEINSRFLFSPKISLREKMRFFTRLVGVYPLIAKLLHHG